MTNLSHILASRWLCLGLALTLLLAGPDAWAKRRKKKGGAKKGRVVALFPLISQGNPNPQVTGKVFTVMLKAPKAIGGIDVLSGSKLKKKLKKPPAKAMAKCGSDLACIAKLGKKGDRPERGHLFLHLEAVLPEGADPELEELATKFKRLYGSQDPRSRIRWETK